MSAVLTMQIMHALFPSLRDTSSPTNDRSTSHSAAIPKIRIEPAEDLELRPLLSVLNRQPAIRHRRSSSASSSSLDRSLECVAGVPHVGFAMGAR
ncbi:hypothetical protein CC86DRAFT_375529 [Ophiobolus disseminans]|uniref:Uncharacterized protein n=1 Tax=Ophiobolus disseminans TaxID=1469910 RepID=A0A6A6ZCX6_9PLEO|nr:hypothetical protein CC86DRAFT_375529 [Ophiobolus disseminans]